VRLLVGFLLFYVLHVEGGSKRFVTIKSKSFDFEIVGAKEDFLGIAENGRGRSSCSCCLRQSLCSFLGHGVDLVSLILPFGLIKCTWVQVVFFWNLNGIGRERSCNFRFSKMAGDLL